MDILDDLCLGALHCYITLIGQNPKYPQPMGQKLLLIRYWFLPNCSYSNCRCLGAPCDPLHSPHSLENTLGFAGSFGFLLIPSSYSCLASAYFFSWPRINFFNMLPLSNGACNLDSLTQFSHVKKPLLFFALKVCSQLKNTIKAEALGFAKLTWITLDHLWGRNNNSYPARETCATCATQNRPHEAQT